MTDEITPMEPKGLIPFPRKPPYSEPVPHTPVTDADNAMDDSVSWLTIILTWVKEHLITEIIQSKNGVPMESKLWYASKTLWVNLIGIIGVFLTPLIGVTLTPELVVIILGFINGVLRLITKTEVVFS